MVESVDRRGEGAGSVFRRLEAIFSISTKSRQGKPRVLPTSRLQKPAEYRRRFRIRHEPALLAVVSEMAKASDILFPEI